MRFLILLVSVYGFCGIENQYREIENKTGCKTIRNIDYIYMINLDQRPEKWERCLKELAAYEIIPQRFAGIYGWALTPSQLGEIGVLFEHGMWTGKEAVQYFPLDGEGSSKAVYLSGAFYGKSCFQLWTSRGTIGCTLSHLSLLKDAYDSYYDRIWILEDDIVVYRDPRILSDLIDKLDALVGKTGWDALFTDPGNIPIPSTSELTEVWPWTWRPDMYQRDMNFLKENRPVGEDFNKIGGRMYNHSIIYNRTGINKIVEFYKTHGNFLPWDHELALIPGIQLYTIERAVVSTNHSISDTMNRSF